MAETASPINPAMAPGGHNVPEFSVTEIAGAVKRTVEDRFGRVRVRGELSQWKLHGPSGHAYFRLKDAGAVLDGVCWKGTVSKLAFKAEDGLEVVATGRISTYPGKSSYQIIVEALEPAGAGALMALLEKRRAQLAAEGLFDAARKRVLPFMPQVIGVVTSPSGAVLRDILHRLADRFPTRVVLWPVAVQGEAAAAQVAEAITGFNALPGDGDIPRPDVLIVARGGGSIEDLWAFNEEVVVRAAAASRIPLISAVGHETDTTLIDFASDRRAPTPTAAAEMATPVRDELSAWLVEMLGRLQGGMTRELKQKNERLTGLGRGLPRPMTLLEYAMQKLDDRCERLRVALPALLLRKEQKLATASMRPLLLKREVEQEERRVQEWSQRLSQAGMQRVQKEEERLKGYVTLMSALDFRNVLKRGFALVTAGGHVVTRAEEARMAGNVRLTFQDGDVAVSVQE